MNRHHGLHQTGGPAPEPAEWVHHFSHAGRSYRLFKIGLNRDGAWYVHLQSANRRWKKSLDTAVCDVAITRAKRFIERVRAGKWTDTVGQRIRAGTLAQVLEHYPRLALIAERSAQNNVLAMRQVIGPDTDPKRFTLDQLTVGLVQRFQADAVRRYAAETEKTEEAQREARERALRSSRSTVCQARSLFNRRLDLPRQYAALDIVIPPSVQEFMSCRLQGRATKREYLAPPDSVVHTAFVEVEKLRTTDLNGFLAFWFAVGAGLRRKEIQALRWEHMVERDGVTWISGGIGKDGQRIEVPMQSRAVEAVAPHRRPASRVLSETGLEWSKRLNWWMRTQGWTTEKKLHELRAYIGSMIYRVNPLAAMRFMRHKSIRITEQFYVRYGTGQAPVDVL